jgi:hypothetical protein
MRFKVTYNSHAWGLSSNKGEDVMEYRTRERIRAAEILPGWLSARQMSKAERLDCWAAALDREGDRQLNTLFQLEYLPSARRAQLRADESLLSVAFADPRLRAEGLAGDTMGDAVAFFGVSERALHDIVCFCHHGPAITARTAAAQIRNAARQHQGIRPVLAGAVVAGSIAAVLLLV